MTSTTTTIAMAAYSNVKSCSHCCQCTLSDAYAFSLFSDKNFYHSDEENASVYMLINRHNCPDVEEKAERIKQMFFARGFGM